MPDRPESSLTLPSMAYSQQDPIAKLTTREAAILNAHVFSDKLSLEMKSKAAHPSSRRPRHLANTEYLPYQLSRHKRYTALH